MIKQLWYGFWTLVLLVGVPIVLLSTIGNPIPNRRAISALVAKPLSEDNMYTTIALVAWLIWAVLLYATLAEIWIRVRRVVRWLRRLPRLPLPTPMQGLTGGMLGAVAVTTTTATADAAAHVDVVAASTLDNVAPGNSVDGQRNEDGVVLPDGGWLPTPIADAITAAAATVWGRRRRLYHPDHDHDAGLAPLPPTAAVVQAALADTPIGGAMAAALDLPPRGVGLTGPGTLGAARGALVALLLTGQASHPRIVTTRDDLAALLGNADTTPAPAAGLHVADDIASMCAAVETTLLDQPGRPVTVLTALPDDPNLVRRLAVLLTLGAEHALTGLILGPWPHGTTWHVDTDGHIDTQPGRLATLTDTATNDLLTLATLQTRDNPASPAPPPLPQAASLPDSPLIRLSLLGPITVTTTQGPVTFRRTAATQILAYLAVHPAGATTGELCTAIWPHRRPHAAAGGFYTTVNHLRQTLHTAAGHEVIRHAGDRYEIDHTVVDSDLSRLLAAAHQAANAPTPAQRDTALRDLVGVYRGELAAGRRWPWVTPLRERLRRLAIDAYAQLAATHPDEAATLWHTAARLVDPINEYVHQQAVHALTAAGHRDKAAALAAEHARHLAATQPVPSL